jgi:transcriptional regulator with GAF, ATPase, and Fis domain
VFDAVVRHESKVLSLSSFRAAIGERSENASERKETSCGDDDDQLFTGCTTLPTLKEANRLLISESLRRTDGNQDAAARMLGLTRTALNRRLNRNP